jgi:hypothetical protein
MMKLSSAVILAASLGLLPAVAAEAATTASSAGATIVASISISNTVGLNFGQIAPSAVIGSVTVATTGVRSSSGGVTLANGTTPTASSFDVTGTGSNTYAITLPTSITMAGPGVLITVDSFVSNPSGSGTLSVGGAQTLLVGATLYTGVSQAAGVYAGTFNVTVAYN